MRARFLVGVAVLAALAWAGVRWLSRDDSPPRGRGDARRDERVEPKPPEPPLLATSVTPAPDVPPEPSGGSVPPPAPSVVLEGTVRMGPMPARSVRVRAVPSGAPSSTPSRGVLTGKDGRFRIEGLEAGVAHRLLVSTGPLSEEIEVVVAAVPGADPVDVGIQPPQRWRPAKPGDPNAKGRVRVVGHDGGTVSQAAARLLMDGGFGGFLDVKDGEFLRSPSEPWGAEYEVINPRDASGQPLPYGPAKVRFEDDGAAVGTVTLPPERVVEGRLVDPTGAGVSGVELHAMAGEPGTGRGAFPEASAKTEADGSFRFRNLSPGPHRVWSNQPPPPPLLVPPEWGFGPDETRIELRYAAGVAVSVRVVDAAGAPVPGSTVSWRSAAPAASGGVVTGRPEFRAFVTNEAGVATVVVDDGKGRFVLAASPPAARTDLRAVEVPDWAPEDRTLVLEAGFTVSGVVRDAAGAAVRGLVLVKQADGKFAPLAGTLADGTFSRGGLAPGPLTLVASRTFTSPKGPERTVEAGSTDVVLVVGGGE